MHLELLPNEWCILEDILKLPRPFKIATKHLSGEKYPTISAWGPLLHEMQTKTIVQDGDSSAIKASTTGRYESIYIKLKSCLSIYPSKIRWCPTIFSRPEGRVETIFAPNEVLIIQE